MSDLLAVDLGATVTGWAIYRDARLEHVGVWRLKRSQREHPGERYRRLRQRLLDLGEVSGVRPDIVAYEKVQMHASSLIDCPKCGRVRGSVFGGRGVKLCRACGSPVRRKTTMNVAAAHTYGATEAYLLEYCLGIHVDAMEIHTSAVKKAATGKGGGRGTAKKDILAAAQRRWPRFTFRTDDAADAAYIGKAALKVLGQDPDDVPPLFREMTRGGTKDGSEEKAI